MKKIISIILACSFMLSMSVMAADFSDMPNDWSTAALEAAVENGLLAGDGGRIRPNDFLTRAEMATIMVRACGAIDEGDLSAYSDVPSDKWYYSAMAKAVAMGAFTGADGKLNPENNITRQEAFVVLARVFSLNIDKDIDTGILKQFKDFEQIAKWAEKEVATIVENGYVKGDANGKINPENNISRAEFAAVMDRLVSYYIDDASVTTIPSDGNVMVRAQGIKLDGIKSDKMIIIGEGVGKTDVTIVNAELSDRLVIRGGSEVFVRGQFNEVRILRPAITVDYKVNEIKRAYGVPGSVFDAGIIWGDLAE